MQLKNDGYDDLRRNERASKVSLYGEDAVVRMESEQQMVQKLSEDLMNEELGSERYQSDLQELRSGPWSYSEKEVLQFAQKRAARRVDKKVSSYIALRRKQEKIDLQKAKNLEVENNRIVTKKTGMSAISLAEIDSMDGLEFELFIAELFKIKGYEVATTKRSGDFGVDLIVEKNHIKTALQAKRYSDSVGVSAIQEVVAGASYYKCDAMMVVTNSRFTAAAEELATTLGVVLLDRDQLVQLIVSIK